MEATTCCAYNASRSCHLSSKVTVASCGNEPLKLMKVMLDGLARDAQTTFWLTHLSYTPQIVRLFPFDVAFLDSDLKVIEVLDLPPEFPLPRFDPKAASALILPHRSLGSNGTVVGDQLIVCSEEELEVRLEEISLPPVVAEVQSFAVALVQSLPVVASPIAVPIPFSSPQVPLPIRTDPAVHGTGFTVSLTRSWQISNSTTAAALLEAAEAEVKEAASADLAIPDATSLEAQEQVVETAIVSGRASPDEVVESAPVSQEEMLPEHDASVSVALEPVAASEEVRESSLPVPSSSPKIAPTVSAKKAAADTPEIRSIEALIARSREAAEQMPRLPRPTRADPVKPKKKSREKKKDPLGTRVIRWLNLEDPLPERRKIIRLLLEGLQAYDANGDGAKTYDVRDVCPPGLFLRAEEKWPPGTVVSLVLQRKGATEKDHERRVNVQARVVRCDEGGIGLEFVFPKGTDFQPWQRLKTKRSDETEADFILRELRLARALGFLQQLCPGAAEEIKHALHERLSNKRVSCAVEIALQAERSLARIRNADGVFAHNDIVMRIIEGGSWIEDDWIRRMWAGLLVSSSTDGQNTSNLLFIDLLARLTPIHLRILSFVCRKADDEIAAGKSPAALDLYCTAEELMEAADSHSFPRIQQTIGHLASVGLFAESDRPSYMSITDKMNTRTTPTALGLKMYACCNGKRAETT